MDDFTENSIENELDDIYAKIPGQFKSSLAQLYKNSVELTDDEDSAPLPIQSSKFSLNGEGESDSSVYSLVLPYNNDTEGIESTNSINNHFDISSNSSEAGNETLVADAPLRNVIPPGAGAVAAAVVAPVVAAVVAPVVAPAVVNIQAQANQPPASSPTITYDTPQSRYDSLVRAVQHPSRITSGMLDVANTVGLMGGIVSLSFLLPLVAGKRRKRSLADHEVVLPSLDQPMKRNKFVN